MYDLSGSSGINFNSVRAYWKNTIIGSLNATSSTIYTHQEVKRVVCIWGLGFSDRDDDNVKSFSLINWLKQQGCCVIGGVPTYSRTSTNDSKPSFGAVYKEFKLISPGTVGRFGTIADDLSFKTNVMGGDNTFCDNNSMVYQRVVFLVLPAPNGMDEPKIKIPA